jgi:hypothetical protein
MGEDLNKSQDLMKTYGAEITGAVASEAASSIVAAAITGSIVSSFASPIGAVVGAGLGVTAKMFIEMTTRSLSAREKVRVGAVATFAITDIKRRLDEGEQLRDDGFFVSKNSSRSEAEEIFEGVLLRAKNAHEERKVKFLSNIYVNAVFTLGVTGDELNHVLQLAESLTYRQMIILSLFNRKAEVGVEMRKEDYSELLESSIPQEIRHTLEQTYQLYLRGLLKWVEMYDAETMEVQRIPGGKFGDAIMISGLENIHPHFVEPTELCKRYYSIMALDEVPIEELRELACCLST